MHYYEICPIGSPSGKQIFLTYSSATRLNIGIAVLIPFGKKQKKGIVWKSVKSPDFATKPIIDVYKEQLPEELMELSQWISSYYSTDLSLVLMAMLPSGIGIKRRIPKANPPIYPSDKLHPLSVSQNNAVSVLLNSSNTTHLLHGVTGAGKTRVYQELTKHYLALNQSVIILVPEIALTPQLFNNFSQLSGDVIALHSKLTPAQRHNTWNKIRQTDKPFIIVGPRSALFTPLKHIGLIVVDECHEPSFIQDRQPKYSALRVARKLADIHKAKLVLGSATPSITDYYYATQTKTPIVEMLEPVHSYDRSVKIIDSRDRSSFTRHPIFSNDILLALENALQNSEQSLLFHNRRATARSALCSSCGWSAQCKDCLTPMRLHHDTHKLKCHICGKQTPLPPACPDCSQPNIEFKGFGSKRIEQEIHKLFPHAKIARFDSDTIENMQLHNRYNELSSGEIDIIIGTQSLAKGLDLPRLSTIGIISSDTELHIPDFSSSERAFQLISQVIGRAGRKGQKSQIIIQTLNPENNVIQTAKSQDYIKFYKQELNERRQAHLPPFTFLLQLQIGYKQMTTSENHAAKLKKEINSKWPKATVRGPNAAFHEYRSGNYFSQLVVTSQSRQTLQEIISILPSKWQYTLDPYNLM